MRETFPYDIALICWYTDDGEGHDDNDKDHDDNDKDHDDNEEDDDNNDKENGENDRDDDDNTGDARVWDNSHMSHRPLFHQPPHVEGCNSCQDEDSEEEYRPLLAGILRILNPEDFESWGFMNVEGCYFCQDE